RTGSSHERASGSRAGMTAETEGLAPGAGRTSAKRRRGPSSRDGFWPWLFLSPILIGMGAFYLWPIVQTFYNTFMSIGPFGSAEFAGLDNYRKLLAEPDFLRSVLNTIIYAGIVLLGVPMAIVISSLLNRPGLRFATLYRTLFFMPYVAMPTAIALVWRTIYNGDFGILNTFLAAFGIDGPHWISTPGYSLAALGAMGLWSALGFSLIILSAGLQNIPTELYEAAQLDGAEQRVPALRPPVRPDGSKQPGVAADAVDGVHVLRTGVHHQRQGLRLGDRDGHYGDRRALHAGAVPTAEQVGELCLSGPHPRSRL